MPSNPSQRPSGTPPLHYDTQIVRRDADYDVEFRGALLATDSYCSDGERFTEVDLFVTESGRFVAVVRFGSHTRTTMRHDAKVCDTPEEVVHWMRGTSGKIGTASKRVLEKANRLYPDLFPLRPVLTVP